VNGSSKHYSIVLIAKIYCRKKLIVHAFKTFFCKLVRLSLIEESRRQCDKTFYGRKLQIFNNKLECLLLASLSSLVYCFRVRPGAYPERCFTWVGSCLTCKHYTILERLARDKHSSLFRKFATYGCKKFCNIGPCSWTYLVFLHCFCSLQQ
jgi:hypothetical protein